MDEYIEREAVHALVQSLTKYVWASPDNTGHRVTVDADNVNFGIDKIPPADVVPMRHGRWIKHDDGVFTCSECENAESNESHFCRYCGAKMMEG